MVVSSPFFFKNCSNLSLVNFAALSETITSGNPRLANDLIIREIVAADVDDI